MATSQSLYYGCHVVAWSRHFEHLHQFGIYAVFNEVAFTWQFHVRVFLAEHSKHGIALFADVFEQLQTLLASYNDGAYHSRENHHVASGKYGKCTLKFHIEQVLYVAVVVGNHLYRCIGSLVHII